MDTIYFFKLKNDQAGTFYFEDERWAEEYFDIEAEKLIRFCGYSYKKKRIFNGDGSGNIVSDIPIKYFCNIDEHNPAMLLKHSKPNVDDVLAGEVFDCYK